MKKMIKLNIKKYMIIMNIIVIQIEYEVYNNFGEKVDLSIYKDVEINIEYKIKNISALDVEKIKYFRQKRIDILKIEDDFFNEICFPFSDGKSNSDMILNDRVSDIYQNCSLCEQGCEYEYLNIETMFVNCNCKIKKQINPIIKEGPFKSYITSSFLNSNFGVIKCYKLVFSFNGKLKNIGFLVFSVLNFINIITYLLYFNKGINPIKNYINKEMSNKGYISNNKNNNNMKNEVLTQNFEEDKKENIIKNGRRSRKKNFI